MSTAGISHLAPLKVIVMYFNVLHYIPIQYKTYGKNTKVQAVSTGKQPVFRNCFE